MRSRATGPLRWWAVVPVAVAVLTGLPSGPAGADAPEPSQSPTNNLASQAWRSLQTGEYRRAERQFTAALALAPREASLYVGMGTVLLRQQREDEGLAMLERAIQLDSNATRAHVLLGDLSARRGDWVEALRHYRIAIRQDPNDVQLQDRLGTAQRGYLADADLDRLFTPHFVVKYHGTGDAVRARDLADRLERIVEEIGRDFGHRPARTIAVVLNEDREFQAAVHGSHWVRGLFDGSLRFSAEGLKTGSADVERTVRHEYTHALVYELAGSHAPAWLSEGLAQVFEGPPPEGTGRPVERDLDAVNPLHLLHGSFTGMSRHEAARAYADSCSAVQVLIARHGLAKIRELLAALAADPNFPRAFETVLGEPYRNFEAAWVSARLGRLN